MAHRPFATWPPCLLLTVLAASAWLTGPGSAQGPNESEGELTKLWEKQHKALFYKVVMSGEKLEKKVEQEVASTAARWYVNRVNWVTVKADSLRLAKVIEDYETDMRSYVLGARAKNAEFRHLFAGELTASLQQILALDFNDRSDQPGILHACLMLPTAAKTKHEKLDELLSELVKNPKTHEAVKNYAAKAMIEYFPVEAVNNVKRPANPARHKRNIARVDALMAFIQSKPSNNLTPEAFSFVRRHAVQALAATEIPAVEIDNQRQVFGPAVLGVLRVLAAKDSKHMLSPAPIITERLEAAIGFCNMKFTIEVDPQDLCVPDIGIYLVGRHFFPDYVDAYRADFAKKAPGATPQYPWKVDAKRLDAAFQKLVENTRSKPAGDQAKKFYNYAKPFVDDMAAYKQILNAVDRTVLEKMLRPNEGTVFRMSKEPNFLE